MVVLPCAMPVTTPVVGSTVATPGVLLVHVPPASPLALKLMVEPAHTDDKPLTVPAFGSEFTKRAWAALEDPQLLVTVYTIRVFPAEIAVTSPVTGSTVATAGLVLLQVPPVAPPI